MKQSDPALESNITTTAVLFSYLFNAAWPLMINTTNEMSEGYFLSEISRNNFSLPSATFEFLFEFCTHLSDIADALNKTSSEQQPTEGPTNSDGNAVGEEWTSPMDRVSTWTLSPGVKATFVFLVLSTSAASVLGNAISVWVTIRIRSTRTTSAFLICLAVTDLLQTFTICTTETANILYDWQWIYGGFLCKAIPFVQTAGALANALTLAAIALGRYLAITDSFRWRALELRKISTFTLLFIASFTIVICLPISFLFEYVESTVDGPETVALDVASALMSHRGETIISRNASSLAGNASSSSSYAVPLLSPSSSRHFDGGGGGGGHGGDFDSLLTAPATSRRTFCWWNSSNEAAKRIYFYVVPACMFLPLFGIIAIMYLYMARYLWIRKPVGESSEPRTQQSKRGRIVKLLALLILVFLCCRGPVQVFNMLQGIKKYNSMSSSVLIFKNCLIVIKLVNCALNPLLYCLLHDRFKAYLMTYLRRVGCGLLSLRQLTTTLYTQADDEQSNENSSNVLADFQDYRAKNGSSGPRSSKKQKGKKNKKKKKITSLPLTQFTLSPLLSPRSRQRGELSWQPGESLTLERLIVNNDHHSV